MPDSDVNEDGLGVSSLVSASSQGHQDHRDCIFVVRYIQLNTVASLSGRSMLAPIPFSYFENRSSQPAPGSLADHGTKP